MSGNCWGDESHDRHNGTFGRGVRWSERSADKSQMTSEHTFWRFIEVWRFSENCCHLYLKWTQSSEPDCSFSQDQSKSHSCRQTRAIIFAMDPQQRCWVLWKTVLDSIALIPHPMRNFASQTQNFVKDSIAPIPHPMRNFASQTPNFVKNMLSLAGQAQTDSLRISRRICWWRFPSLGSWWLL